MNSNQTIAQFLKIQTFPFIIKDEKGNEIYVETSYGYWLRSEYNSNGKSIYFENSNGFWSKSEYNSDGKEIYTENSNGTWIKREFDCNGDVIYLEDSDGLVHDDRPKPVLEISLEEIAKLKGVSVSQIRIKE